MLLVEELLIIKLDEPVPIDSAKLEMVVLAGSFLDMNSKVIVSDVATTFAVTVVIALELILVPPVERVKFVTPGVCVKLATLDTTVYPVPVPTLPEPVQPSPELGVVVFVYLLLPVIHKADEKVAAVESLCPISAEKVSV